MPNDKSANNAPKSAPKPAPKPMPKPLPTAVPDYLTRTPLEIIPARKPSERVEKGSSHQGRKNDRDK